MLRIFFTKLTTVRGWGGRLGVEMGLEGPAITCHATHVKMSLGFLPIQAKCSCEKKYIYLNM